MSRKRKIENKNLTDHKDYRSGLMSEKERNAFEKRLEADPFEKEAAEGFLSLDDGAMTEDIERLHRRLGRRLSGRGLTLWYRISAAAVLLLLITSLFLVRELRRPEILVSDNLQGFDTLTRDLKSEPEVNINETETIDKAKAEVNDTRLRIDSPELPVMEEIVKEKIEELVPARSNDLIVAEKGIGAEKIENLRTEDIRYDSLAEAKVIEVSPMARTADKNMAKRAKMEEAIHVEESLSGMVSGIVISSDDKLPLPGASIVVKGSTRGVVSDFNGQFRIGADSNQTLIASFIGMESKEIKISGEDLGNIVLEPDLASLDEVIVVAYGLQGKAAGLATGAVTKVDLEEEVLNYSAPFPEGGMALYREYIKESIVFPSDYTASDREVVRVRFTVSPGKSPFGFEIVRSPGEEFSKEAIRLISEGPAWTPAISSGEPFEDKVSLRIVFRR